MPLFPCAKCGCIENTALSNWAITKLRNIERVAGEPPRPPLCSACDPEIGRWHGEFERRSAVGMVVGTDGFLYTQEQFDTGQVHHTKPDHVITEAP